MSNQIETESKDYKTRTYLSAIEAAKYLGISVDMLHNLANKQIIKVQTAASGQMRFDLRELKKHEKGLKFESQKTKVDIDEVNVTEVNGTLQKIFVKNSMEMGDLLNDSVHFI